jgi:hypothetical protein
MTDSPKNFSSFRPASRGGAALEARADELRASLQLLEPHAIAQRADVRYLEIGPDRGEFHLTLLGAPVIGAYPNLVFFSPTGDELPAIKQALLLYYFHTASGAPLTGKYVSFADLPGGRMYAQAYQGYSGDEVARHFGLSLEKFKSACEKIGGEPVQMADAAYTFQGLPRVPVLVTYWQGDEDFPSTCKTLFDASATESLPIDGCAILGSMLTGKIIKAGST